MTTQKAPGLAAGDNRSPIDATQRLVKAIVGEIPLDEECRLLKIELRKRALDHLIRAAWRGDVLAISALDAAGIVKLAPVVSHGK